MLFKNVPDEVEGVVAGNWPFFKTCLRIFVTVSGWRATVNAEYMTVPMQNSRVLSISDHRVSDFFPPMLYDS